MTCISGDNHITAVHCIVTQCVMNDLDLLLGGGGGWRGRREGRGASSSNRCPRTVVSAAMTDSLVFILLPYLCHRDCIDLLPSLTRPFQSNQTCCSRLWTKTHTRLTRDPPSPAGPPPPYPSPPSPPPPPQPVFAGRC